jgi:hypothetical protein
LKKAKSKTKRPDPDDCVFPPLIAAKDLARLVMPRNDDEAEDCRYVEWQGKDEKVEHAEKLSIEFVMGRKHECWDVRTDKTRWWVITSPTNLYSQELMPSLDYTLSFHVGVMARVASANKPDVNELEQLVMADAWRRWEQAGERGRRGRRFPISGHALPGMPDRHGAHDLVAGNGARGISAAEARRCRALVRADCPNHIAKDQARRKFEDISKPFQSRAGNSLTGSPAHRMPRAPMAFSPMMSHSTSSPPSARRRSGIDRAFRIDAALAAHTASRFGRLSLICR